MNTKQVREQIINMPQFKDFKFGDKDNYATMEVSPRTFRDENKKEFKLLSPYSIFIAHMYEGQADKEFFYILVSRRAIAREFRKHLYDSVEFNKICVTGKTVDEIIGSLQEKFDDGYDFL